MRVYVAVNLNGSVQYYQRDREERSRDGQWFSQPFFVTERLHATQMDEAAAKSLVNRLRNDFRESPWLESVQDRARIDVPREGYPQEPEQRKPVIATLDDVNWYIVKPANTPNGPRWFVSVMPPGRVVGDPDPIYADTPLSVLERIHNLGWTHLLERYVPPAAPAPVQPQTNLPRLRPGSR